MITILFPSDLTITHTDCMSWYSSDVILNKCILDATNNILYAFIDYS